MDYVYNDGGRALLGFRAKVAGDCVTRAIAIATQTPYAEVAAALDELALRERTGKRKKKVSHSQKGVFKTTYRKYMDSRGWVWVPTMEIGSGCKVHLIAEELPRGRLVVSVSKHMVAVIDGVINDIYDPSREGTRCVYGYFMEPK